MQQPGSGLSPLGGKQSFGSAGRVAKSKLLPPAQEGWLAVMGMGPVQGLGAEPGPGHRPQEALADPSPVCWLPWLDGRLAWSWAWRGGGGGSGSGLEAGAAAWELARAGGAGQPEL